MVLKKIYGRQILPFPTDTLNKIFCIPLTPEFLFVPTNVAWTTHVSAGHMQDTDVLAMEVGSRLVVLLRMPRVLSTMKEVCKIDLDYDF